MLIPLDGKSPLYRQIYRHFRSIILQGHLSGGTRLPATRSLAEELGISRNVVLAAYQQLVDEGYGESRVGSGTFVAPELPERSLQVQEPRTSFRPDQAANAPPNLQIPAPALSAFGRRLQAMGPMSDPDELPRPPGAAAADGQIPYDFRYGLALPDPATAVVWRRLLNRHARKLPMEYDSPRGSPALRRALAAYLHQSRGLAVDPSQIVITSGSQQAIDLLIRLLAEADDTIAIEDPGYRGARQVFVAAGLRIQSCTVDEQGLNPADLDVIESREHGARRARWIYVTPSHQFPTGAVMPVERRLTLLDWAAAHDAYVIEDDYDSELRYEGPPLEAVAALDRQQRVLYVGTLSKVLFPALRLGYVVLPEPLVEIFTAAKRLTDRHSPSLEQRVLADFFAEGHFNRHLRRMRRRNSRRLQVFRQTLNEVFGHRARAASSAAGIHLMVSFPDHSVMEVNKWVQEAKGLGVGLYPLEPYFAQPPQVPGLLFGYANLDEDQIREGLRRLATVVGGS